MANSQVESSPLSSDLAAPEGFYTIREIQDLPSDQIRANIFVNVIGLVEDYRPPVQTKGNGKCLPILVQRCCSNMPKMKNAQSGLRIILFNMKRGVWRFLSFGRERRCQRYLVHQMPYS